MELFEILFILFFILIPVMEGIRKSRQRRDSKDIELPDQASPRSTRHPEPAARRDRYGAPADRPAPERPHPEPEPTEASDMIPDDLWEILTGERRERSAPVEHHGEAEEQEEEPWMAEPDDQWKEEPRWEPEAEPVMKERFEPRPWMDSPEAMRDEESPRPLEVHVPVEERPGRAPRPPRPPRVSLREVVEAPKVQRRTSPLMRSLQSREGMRQAVLLKEILGRPKGLDF